jgi:phospholipase C
MERIDNKIYISGNKTRIFIWGGLTGKELACMFKRVSQMMPGNQINMIHIAIGGQTLLKYLRDVR